MSYDWLQYLDQYCERVSPGIWSEPLNLLSNLAFFFAAGFALTFWQQAAIRQKAGLLVGPVLLLAIGIGSGLFHSFATAWAQGFDVGFIAIYVLWFMALWNHQVLGLSWQRNVLVFLAFFALSAICVLVFSRIPINGSEGYLAVAIFLFHFSYQQKNILSGSSFLRIAAWVFLLSLIFRSLDQYLCQSLPFGTHFLWHALNALVLTLSFAGLLHEIAWKSRYHWSKK